MVLINLGLKVFTVYQEAVTYQRQLNLVRNVIGRVERGLEGERSGERKGGIGKGGEKKSGEELEESCSDKLRSVAEALLDILLSTEGVLDMDLETCKTLFEGFCVSQTSRLQFLTATLLNRACGKKPFWGTFLSETLAKMFSSSYNSKFPQDRIFILLAYLSRKSPERSAILDATLRVISQTLSPLAQSRKALLAVSVDLPLLGWLLMFLSLQLDLGRRNARWEWVVGEMGAGPKAGTEKEGEGMSKRKLHKRLLSFHQHNLDWTHKIVQNSAPGQVSVCLLLLLLNLRVS